MRAHLHGVVEGADGVGDGAAAVGVEELQGHDLHVPVDAGHADAVVAHGADGAGHVRAVAVVVHRVAVVVDEVVAVDVVDEAVAVVVDAVAGDLAGVGPDVGGQVGVGVIDAGVDDGDDDAAAAGGDVPGFRGVDVGVGRAAGLAGVVQAPEGTELRVVRNLVQLQEVVRDRVDDPGTGAIRSQARSPPKPCR